MQTSTVELWLSEGLEHLQDLARKFRDGTFQPDDEPTLGVALDHILDHISLAWNCRDMSVDEVGALPQGEFERLSNTVPSYFGTKVIAENP